MAQFGRYSSENLFEGATQTLMGLKALKQRGEIAGERTAIMKTQADTSKGHLDLAREKHKLDFDTKPVPEKPFTEGEIKRYVDKYPVTNF